MKAAAVFVLPVLVAISPARAFAQDAQDAQDAQPASAAASSSRDRERDHQPAFGDRNTIVLTGALHLGFGSSFYDDPNVYSTNIRVAPSVHWFPMDNLSLGAGGTFGWSSAQGYGTHGAIDRRTGFDYGVDVSMGYNVPLGRYLSWWPRFHVGFSGASTKVESSEIAEGHDRSQDLGGLFWEHKNSGPYVYAFAPLLVHPVPHWYFGLGPSLYRDLGRKHENAYPTRNDRTTVSLYFTSGIWF